MANPDIIYNFLLDVKLRNNVITNIINYMFEQCQIEGEISYVRYHWVNRKSISQEKDDFEIMLNENEKQIIILIPFTNLDVKVETKMKDTTLVANKTEMVHCYIKPHSCIYIRKEM